MRPNNQILTVAQMRDAEQALIDGGESISSLMEIAGLGAADLVWRMAAHRPVTVLCGPGNNGGDGYLIARELHRRGAEVRVIAPLDPVTDAARAARASCAAPLVADARGGVLVDCLFGSGLTRPLSPDHLALLQRLAAHHRLRVAVDLPSGIDSDRGMPLNDGLPDYHLTIALGAWKFAHFLMPGAQAMGDLRLVPIGVEPVPGAAQALARPRLRAPGALAHKYTRGLLAVVGGAMPGAALLAATAAQRAGAGYVKLLPQKGLQAPVPADLVADPRPLADALDDSRIGAVLLGPGLG
ncbi:MAG: NAD(P)H-hydrate epimerase, partial [Croceibacterium sp.]